MSGLHRAIAPCSTVSCAGEGPPGPVIQGPEKAGITEGTSPPHIGGSESHTPH